jgi:hypothetical protein
MVEKRQQLPQAPELVEAVRKVGGSGSEGHTVTAR